MKGVWQEFCGKDSLYSLEGLGGCWASRCQGDLSGPSVLFRLSWTLTYTYREKERDYRNLPASPQAVSLMCQTPIHSPIIWRRATSSTLRCKFLHVLLCGTLLTCQSCHAFLKGCFKCCTLKAVVRINGSAAVNLELIFHQWRSSKMIKMGSPKATHPHPGALMIENYLDLNRK